MTGWASIALAAAALLLLGATPGGAGGDVPAPGEGVCELRGVDREQASSLRCMACHDGSAGPSIPFQMGPGGGESMSHPVGVDYASVAARQPDRYAPPGSLPREVPLVHGQVACTSCHDGASADPKRIAIPEQRLCQACHRL